MKQRARVWILAIGTALLTPAAYAENPAASISLSNPLIADVSQNKIEIRSDFNGTNLLLFGAQNAPGDLVIVVRGPNVNATLRRKERIAGMWMPVDQRKYEALPTFYALASTKPLSRIASPQTLQSLGLGENRIIRASNTMADEVFDHALVNILSRKRWWQSPFTNISYFGESLFKARIDLPDTLPGGPYSAEIYLFDRGRLISFQVIPIVSYKVGFDASITRMAMNHSLLYGIVAICMALFGGWLGHRLFNRR